MAGARLAGRFDRALLRVAGASGPAQHYAGQSHLDQARNSFFLVKSIYCFLSGLLTC
jgi:hypothetical protein